jgi:polyisoprenoid-binding protein YceI
MSTQTTTVPISQAFRADPVHSSFGFAVRHLGVSAFRGTLEDVHATLTPAGAGLALEGAAQVESISVHNPPELRAHLLSEEFFDAERHPEVTFRSRSLELTDDGRARLEGELTIRGITRPVTATGTWAGPRETPAGVRAALELQTTFDRRDFGMDWQMEAPDGGLALDWDVTLTAQVELIPVEA